MSDEEGAESFGGLLHREPGGMLWVSPARTVIEQYSRKWARTRRRPEEGLELKRSAADLNRL